jgi:hypothetical protein
MSDPTLLEEEKNQVQDRLWRLNSMFRMFICI